MHENVAMFHIPLQNEKTQNMLIKKCEKSGEGKIDVEKSPTLTQKADNHWQPITKQYSVALFILLFFFAIGETSDVEKLQCMNFDPHTCHKNISQRKGKRK